MRAKGMRRGTSATQAVRPPQLNLKVFTEPDLKRVIKADVLLSPRELQVGTSIKCFSVPPNFIMNAMLTSVKYESV